MDSRWTAALAVVSLTGAALMLGCAEQRPVRNPDPGFGFAILEPLLSEGFRSAVALGVSSDGRFAVGATCKRKDELLSYCVEHPSDPVVEVIPVVWILPPTLQATYPPQVVPATRLDF